MKNGYNVVVNTAAGRNRYMKLLIPYVLSCDIVDRYDLWVNTLKKEDLIFFELLAKKFEKINLIYIEDNKYNGINSIFGFYKNCIEKNTIYVKVDDDLIWMEPDAITKLVEYRIANPQFFVVSPLVINNCIGTFLLQTGGKVKLTKYLRPSMTWASAWCSANFAYDLQEWFRQKILDNSYTSLHMGSKPIAMQRFSINMISWFGETFAHFGGVCPMDDEEYFSVVKPTEMSMCNSIFSDVIVVHYAFTFQREELDKSDILQKYADVIKNGFAGQEVKEIYNEVVRFFDEISTANLPIVHYVDQKKESEKKNGLALKIIMCIGDVRIPGTFYSMKRLWRIFRESYVKFDKIKVETEDSEIVYPKRSYS